MDKKQKKNFHSYNKIDKPLVVYRFTGNGLTSITMLRT